MVFQTILFEMSEVKVTVPPTQNVVGPFALIIGAVGFVSTVISTGSEVAEQPATLVTVTVYKPAFETTIELEVSLAWLHKLFVLLLLKRVTLLPWQNVVGPNAFIEGCTGFSSTTTLIGAEETEQPLTSVKVAK